MQCRIIISKTFRCYILADFIAPLTSSFAFSHLNLFSHLTQLKSILIKKKITQRRQKKVVIKTSKKVLSFTMVGEVKKMRCLKYDDS